MALIKSKQIKDLAAIKVVETAEKRFVSDTEKAVYSDKYTKLEMDGTISTVNETIDTAKSDAKADATSKANTAKDEAIATAAVDASSKAGVAEANAKSYADSIHTTVSSQITNAIAGLTWKAPVATFNDIATTYPTPKEGYMVTVADTNKVFRYDLETTSWVEFPIQASTTYSKTILASVTQGQTIINTGIRNDGTGVYKSSHPEIVLAVNGFIQHAGSGLDYTAVFVSNELVVTWLNRNFTLDADDEVSITYTHFDVV